MTPLASHGLLTRRENVHRVRQNVHRGGADVQNRDANRTEQLHTDALLNL
jgi:hypothetical protein